MTEVFHSQLGQDRFVFEHFFKDRPHGVFLDIGAYDGVTFSNTLFFEDIGWRGVCVEPQVEMFQKLRKNRSCVCLCTAIDCETGVRDFCIVEEPVNGRMLSGFTSDRHTQFSLTKVTTPTSTIDEVMDLSGFDRVDFCSIDVEGAELAVLAGWDPQKHWIDVLTIEDNDNDPRLLRMMDAYGYDHVKTLSCDKVFKRR